MSGHSTKPWSVIILNHVTHFVKHLCIATIIELKHDSMIDSSNTWNRVSSQINLTCIHTNMARKTNHISLNEHCMKKGQAWLELPDELMHVAKGEMNYAYLPCIWLSWCIACATLRLNMGSNTNSCGFCCLWTFWISLSLNSPFSLML